jgi:dTDP_gluc_dehyt: dTDP-glucose 4,6-dehydratase
MTCVMQSTRLRFTTNLAGYRKQNSQTVSRKQSNGIWITRNGGKLSSPENIRTTMKKCTHTAGRH